MSPKLNHNHSSLFISWSVSFSKILQVLTSSYGPSTLVKSVFFYSKQANKKGCYNTLCPGFVQVSRKFPLGSVARPVSKYGGKQFHLEISIYQVYSTNVLKFSHIESGNSIFFTKNMK